MRKMWLRQGHRKFVISATQIINQKADMMHYDSSGNAVQEGDSVIFRGQKYTIKRFLDTTGACGTSQIEFNEDQHTNEIADEISIDKI